jgi:tetratricopeptide (TPR) repeat protein
VLNCAQGRWSDSQDETRCPLKSARHVAIFPKKQIKIKPLTQMILLAILTTLSYSQTVESILKQANIDFIQGDYSKSLDSYDQAIKLDPTRPASYLMRFSVYMTLGKNDLAIKDFNKVIELRPSALNVI